MTEIRTPSPEEMQAIMQQVRRDRSAFFAAGTRKAARAVIGFLRTFTTTFAEARRQQALYEELSRMSDRELRDIGLYRSDIPAVVAGTYDRNGGAGEPEAEDRPTDGPGRPETGGERLAA